MSQRNSSGLSPLWKVLTRIAVAVDHSIGWDKLPLPISLAVLIALRKLYRWRNLYDTSTLPTVGVPPIPTPPDQRHLTARTADGTFNDLLDPRMGSAGTRFGRNIPLRYAYPAPEPDIMQPNPRTISRELLTRETFQ